MKMSLEHYSDLGKYCWPTSMDTFDTETDKIFIYALNFEKKLSTCEIPIESLDDLIPFLWSQPFIEQISEGKHTLIYTSSVPDPWWYRYPMSLIERCESSKNDIILKLRKSNEKLVK